MQQFEFIYMAKTLKVQEVLQGDPEIIVKLKDGILVKHNHQKNNAMYIEMKDAGKSYLIPSKKELEDIYRIYLENESFTQLLYEYLEEKLEKIE